MTQIIREKKTALASAAKLSEIGRKSKAEEITSSAVKERGRSRN
jgi:hypothetical protein